MAFFDRKRDGTGRDLSRYRQLDVIRDNIALHACDTRYVTLETIRLFAIGDRRFDKVNLENAACCDAIYTEDDGIIMQHDDKVLRGDPPGLGTKDSCRITSKETEDTAIPAI